MRAYPLIRRTWSNEHIMAMLFAVVLLYLIPRWVRSPSEIPAFLAVLAAALVIDSLSGFIKYKRLVCSVSAAITAGVLQVITPDIPLWGRLIGIAAAILLGKVLWGGTGKNALNPAIVGYVAIYFLFGGGYAPISPSTLLIPAMVVSLPFILYRPFASIGLMGGMALGMASAMPDAGWMTIVANCLFFGCIVITDPVTTTPTKLPGLLGGFAAGFIPLQMASPALNFALSILIFNLISFLIDDFRYRPAKLPFYKGIAMKGTVQEMDYGKPVIDFTGESRSDLLESSADAMGSSSSMPGKIRPHLLESLSPEQVIERIEKNSVYGSGGAAFPTAEKIRAVQASGKEEKYLIINGTECDPGLIHDKWLMRNRMDAIEQGIHVVSKCIGFTKIFLAIKDASGIQLPETVQLHQTEKYYPAGYEKFLVRNILKRKLPDDAVPSKEGILVLNVQTLILIYEAVFLNRKAESKYITVSDIKRNRTAIVKVKLGDKITKVANTVYPERQPVFAGGGVMQAYMAEEDSVIDKNTNFIAISNMPRYKESPFCSNCGACEAHCPSGLRVGRIAALKEEGKSDELIRYQPEKCIKCGICSYVCPAGRNLSARITEAKSIVPKAISGSFPGKGLL